MPVTRRPSVLVLLAGTLHAFVCPACGYPMLSVRRDDDSTALVVYCPVYRLPNTLGGNKKMTRYVPCGWQALFVSLAPTDRENVYELIVLTQTEPPMRLSLTLRPEMS